MVCLLVVCLLKSFFFGYDLLVNAVDILLIRRVVEFIFHQLLVQLAGKDFSDVEMSLFVRQDIWGFYQAL